MSEEAVQNDGPAPVSAAKPNTAVIVSEIGLPFESAKVAKMAMKNKGLEIDAWEVGPYEEGYGIYPKGLAPFDKKSVKINMTAVSPVKEAEKEKYWKAMFGPKTTPNDTIDVQLAVNGEVLNIQREEPVIIPDRFRVCADNATITQYTQRPGETRQMVGRMRIYNYSIMGEASEEEYIAFKNRGNQIQRDHLDRMQKEAQPNRAVQQ